MKTIDVNTLRDELKNNPEAVILDVRTPEEENEGLIENSLRINIMENSFPATIMDLDKSKTYYVYCRSGGRSASACQFMDKQGLKAINVEGGIIAWNQTL